jgi:hypothetical protein
MVSDDSREQVLRGGNSIGDVVRVGDTVRRQAGPWSSSIDALLLHLESVGFEGAPRALGYDDRGRQVLSYVPGHVDSSPVDLTRSQVFEVGRLIRDFHDAVSTFIPPKGSVWNVAIPPNEELLICHHDLAPWNLVRGPTNFVFIDWDGAGPGSRLWDLSYAAHGFTPLSPATSTSDKYRANRLAALVDGYALDNDDRRALIAMLVPRIRSMYSLLKNGNESGTEPWKTLWSQGHGNAWLEDAAFTEQRIPTWAAALI